MLARISLDSAGPRDLRALASSLACLPALKTALEALRAPLWRDVARALDPLDDVSARIVRTVVPEPPLTLADGGAIEQGVDAELDDLRSISTDGRKSIAAIEERERHRTGIGSLKVRYNSVFGYYIEITKSNLALAPADYQAKTDAGERRALHYPGIERIRTQDSHRARPLHRNRKATLC